MSKVVGLFVKFWHFFTMPAHQMWSYHVTQEANFENFLFCTNSTFNIRKVHKISSGKALYFRSYQPKNSRGVGGWWKTPSSAFRVKEQSHFDLILKTQQPVSFVEIVREMKAKFYGFFIHKSREGRPVGLSFAMIH